MHSARALLVLTALAAVLVAVVVVDGQRLAGPVAADPHIVPELARTRARADETDITRITWQRAGATGAAERFALVRDAGGDWQLDRGKPARRDNARGPRTCPVDPDVASDVVATLEHLSYVRSFARDADEVDTGLSPPRVTLTIVLATGARVTLALGARIRVTDRVWLARAALKGDALQGDDDRRDPLARIYLVEGYVGRALDRQPDDLCEHRFVTLPAEDITGIEIHAGEHALVISGRPPAIDASAWIAGAGRIRMDPTSHAELVDVLTALTMARFAWPGDDSTVVDATAADAPAALTVRVLGAGLPATLAELGACPGDSASLRLVDSSLGRGCVAAAALARVRAQASRGRDLLAHMLLTRPAPAAITVRTGAPDGDVLHLVAHGSAWSMTFSHGPEIPGKNEQPTEPGSVATWLTGLQAATGGRFLALAELGRPVDSLAVRAIVEARYDDEERAIDRITFSLHPGRGLLARRNGEAAVLAVGAGAGAGTPGAALGPAALAARFRRRQLLSLDPYALSSAVARRGNAVIARLERGELLDEFVATVPAGQKPVSTVIEALRGVARLRAVAFAGAPASPENGLETPRLAIELTFDPGPLDSQPVQHVLALGNRAANDDQACHARLDAASVVFLLERAVCDALLGPWTRP